MRTPRGDVLGPRPRTRGVRARRAGAALLAAACLWLAGCGAPDVVGTWVAEVEPTVDAMLAAAGPEAAAGHRETFRREMLATLEARLEVRSDGTFTWAHTLRTSGGNIDDHADGEWRLEKDRYAFYPRFHGRQQWVTRMDGLLEGDRLNLTAGGKPFRLKRS